ncbi:MAG: tetratricopeptide repeat protein [Deltaproteobacteria bacterium]|nr:tetratricopeptide repeat protein [Deltaproteobacteria bacterium]MCL5277437.1 tetratricopeptide repeat protein [Deltaproteobacteria bacterium]
MNKRMVIFSMTCFLLCGISAAAQPINRARENSATEQLIKEQTTKPLSALDWYNRGVAMNNNSDEELACYKKAVEIDSTFAPAYYNMGIIYMKRDMNTEAIDSFNKFLQYSSDEAKKSQVRKAIEGLSGTSPATPGQAVSPDLRQRAIALYNQGSSLNNDSDAEMQYYLQAVALYPGFAAAHMNLGLLYYHRKDYRDAMDELTAYIEYTNDPPEKRKEVLNLIEWLQIAIKSQQSQQSQQTQQQQFQPGTQPAAPPPAQNNINNGTQQLQEVPLQ